MHVFNLFFENLCDKQTIVQKGPFIIRSEDQKGWKVKMNSHKTAPTQLPDTCKRKEPPTNSVPPKKVSTLILSIRLMLFVLNSHHNYACMCFFS